MTPGNLCSIAVLLASLGASTSSSAELVNPAELAGRVRIYRDEYGVPHIFGADDESTVFGFGYAQAEDYFWQVEDSYILALGRYSEIHGPQGLNSDLLNRAFEIVPRSRRDFAALDRTSQRLCAAFAAGLNRYLETHPAEKPRLLNRFEPWHVLAYHRHVALELTFRFSGLSEDYLPRRNPQVWAATGSNGWAANGARTAGGTPMLLASPHMPWFGFSQLMEAHLHCAGAGGEGSVSGSGRGWNFIGAGFYGSPMLAMGHNDRLGWTLVTNMPDIADVWRVRFTHPDEPLSYKYDGGWRQAIEWTEIIKVRKGRSIEDRKLTFRKTHHGPVVVKENDTDMLAVQICGLFDGAPMRQSLGMIKARNLAEFKTSLAPLQMLFMNIVYADCDGNIWYLYDCRAPRRNPRFDWSQPVDGSNPETEWLGVHDLAELPQVLNPPAGFLQNCNSTPFSVTDGDNPRRDELARYVVRDAEVRNRRSLRSLELLRGLNGASFDMWQRLAFDGEVYWARHELPQFASKLEKLRATDPALEAEVRPYLTHLLAWNGQITAESTAASLCHAWYEQLYGPNYPGEQLRDSYRDKPDAQFRALVHCAEELSALHGDWKVPYGQLHRIARVPRIADLTDLRFNDRHPSLPLVGGHGPMGVAFTTYYSPSVDIPLLYSQKKRFGVAGASYVAAWEFAPEGVRGVSLVPFGASGNPDSPHYFDQAKLLSERQLKPERFSPQQVMRYAVRSYRP